MADPIQDKTLYRKWKQDPTKENFQGLYNHFKPLLRSAMSKSSYYSNVPNSVFKLRAAQQFYDSLNSYSEGGGAKLHSHIYGSVQNKVKRINTDYGSLSRITERNKDRLGVFQINDFNNAKLMLEEKLGREPSPMELSEELNVSINDVERFSHEIKKTLSLNEQLEDLVTFQDISEDEAEMAMLYYDLSPEQQLVFDYASGTHGKQAILKANRNVDWERIARTIGISLHKVQKARDHIVKRWETISK